MPAQFPLSGWTPGATLANYRELVFGTFIFALSAQEVSRLQKLNMTKAPIPFTYGDYVHNNQFPKGRELQFMATVGSGMVGTSGSSIQTADDLEAERSALAALQDRNLQRLWTRPDRYLNAYLESFDNKPMQDGGAFRFADWDLKFFAPDPRYYGATLNTFTSGSITSTAVQTRTVSHGGNTKVFPVITITGAGTNPSVYIQQASGKYIQLTFTLTMAAGDQLVITTDPRPENRQIAAQYTPSGGSVTNALKYIAVPAGFANNLDARYIFPFIEATDIAGGTQTLGVQLTGSPNYTYTIAYRDTWL